MKLKKILIIVSCIVFLLIGFIFIQNQIVTVDKVSLIHKDLPKDFEGYKILQITDLHQKQFGKNQKRIVNKINNEDYDIIVLTGDYLDYKNTDLKPLENLLKGIKSDVDKYFIIGNSEEEIINRGDMRTNEIEDLFNKYNVQSLYPGVEIKKGNSSIWLTKDTYDRYNSAPEDIKKYHEEIVEESKNNKEELKYAMYEKKYAYKEIDFIEKYKKQENPFTIQVVHRALSVDYIDEHLNSLEELDKASEEKSDNKWLDWQMSISGHTHGGQVRLPFIGAVASPNSGLFPDEIGIDGVHYFKNKSQYICSGLGASGPKFLKFRVFNPPEIGLIELKSK